MCNSATDSKPASEVSLKQIASAVHKICQSYGHGFQKYAAQELPPEERKDRRSLDRDSISLPFYLWPVIEEENGRSRKIDTAIIAVTRDISDKGIGFRCDVPILTSRFVAEFDCETTGRVRMLVEVLWKRKHCGHCYLAGGRILRILDTHELV